ncbi:MAG: hypothetical protein IJ615_07305 [Bacteroidaceae bacterium]|nr:hypothetical protein [Bacteroidaceae bacterium]
MTQNRLMRLQSLLVVMLTMFSVSAMAGNSKYYSKATAKVAEGEGKVYVSYASAVEEDAREYAAESSAESGADEQSSAPSHSYYLYAQAGEDYKFSGWYATEECSGNPASTDNPYIASITADTKVESATQTFYAKFEYVDPTLPYFEFSQDHIYVNIDATPAVPDGLLVKNVTATAASSNTAVVEVDEAGTLTPKAPGTATVTLSSEGYEDIAFLVTVINNVEAGVTQIGNGDFEDWRGVTSSNDAPDNWNSFQTNEGSFASFARAKQVQMVEGGRPGSNGLYCVDIWSRSVLGIAAQGNLTTGCINAGATTASDKGNYNFSKTSDPKKSETLSRIPSAIRFWAKFVPAAENAEHPNAHMEAVVHDAYDYITYSDPSFESDEEKAHVIAKARKDFPATNGEWQMFEVPFEWTGSYTDGQMYIIVNLATNADPGQGQADDHLYVDDVELVYNDEPATVTYEKYVSVGNGTPVETSIDVTYRYNDANTLDFNLKNFSLGETTNIGNVTIDGLEVDSEGKFSFDGTIQITAGDKEGVDMWMGPMLGDIPLVMEGTIRNGYFYVLLNIDIPGSPVRVEVGDKGEATLAVGESLIGTFCAPFAVVLPEEYQQYVSTVTGADEKGLLTLTAIETPVLPANTPVVVQTPAAIEMVVSGIIVKGMPTVGLLTGVYTDTPAPAGSYVLQNNNERIGFYQVATGRNNQPTVKANRCYLTAPAAEVKAFFFDEDEATGMNEELRVKSEDSSVYNLAGQRLGKVQRGINIVNGKKVLVK